MSQEQKLKAMNWVLGIVSALVVTGIAAMINMWGDYSAYKAQTNEQVISLQTALLKLDRDISKRFDVIEVKIDQDRVLQRTRNEILNESFANLRQDVAIIRHQLAPNHSRSLRENSNR